jgi:hypothetical protein
MASYNDYLANRRVWATIKKEMQVASVTVFTEMQQLLAYDVAAANVAHAAASAAAAMANAAAATANAAAETASEAAASAGEAAASAGEAAASAGEAAASAGEAIGAVTEHAAAAATHAAAASASAAELSAVSAMVEELFKDEKNPNKELIDKIEYLFMMFYHSDSNSIMESYPLAE